MPVLLFEVLVGSSLGIMILWAGWMPNLESNPKFKLSMFLNPWGPLNAAEGLALLSLPDLIPSPFWIYPDLILSSYYKWFLIKSSPFSILLFKICYLLRLSCSNSLNLWSEVLGLCFKGILFKTLSWVLLFEWTAKSFWISQLFYFLMLISMNLG